MKTELNLSILSSGKVAPEPGSKVEAELPHQRINLQTDQWKQWQQHPRLRRCSPLTLFMAEAAQQTLRAAPGISPARTGLIGVFFTGAIQYSVRFYRDAVKNGAKFASPILFPETVFNSPLSHLVHLFQLGGPSYALVHDESAWVAAFRVAATWLLTQQCDQVLIVAAEEIDAISLEAYRTARWYRKNPAFFPSEGAGAVLVSPHTPSALGEILSLSEVHPYSNSSQLPPALAACLAEFPSRLPIWATTAQSWFDPIVNKTLSARGPVHRSLGEGGWAFPASAAWHTIDALAEPGTWILPIIGSTHHLSALSLKSNKRAHLRI